MNKKLKTRKLTLGPNLLIGIFLIYYLVGTALFMMDWSRALFQVLTPLSLVLSFAAVLVFQKEWSVKLGIAFIVTFVSSLIIEMIGVHTGVLFGNYSYGSSLGPKIFHTPLLIGLNWLFLVYGSAAIVNHHFKNRFIKVLLGALIMVAYDVILEYVAPAMDMWSWDTSYPGIRNFLMWFLISFALHLLFQLLRLRIENKPARYLIIIQFGFFCLIALSII